MATAPACISIFEREAVFIASPERIGRALRERAPSGSWPSSPIGGGEASPHATPRHLANFMVAQAGFVPSGADKALAKLREFPFWDIVQYPEMKEPDPPKVLATATLGETLEFMINEAAENPEWLESLVEWSLTMSPDDPAYAIITHQLRGRPAYQTRFSMRSFEWMAQERDRAQRTIEIPRKALVICGDLWRDSKAKLATTNENADPPARGPAPSTAPTARMRQDPNNSDANARVRAPATTGVTHARHRRRSPARAAPGAP